MRIDKGWLSGAEICESSHSDDRPDPKDISMVVIHNISLPAGIFSGSEVMDLFMGQLDCDKHASFASLCDLRVSAHVLIRRSGEIIQFVPFHRRAWHAGVSSYNGRPECNDYAIGIELEGTDTWAYTYAQYASLLVVVKLLCISYPNISPERVVGHSDIAPGRKTDPGSSFDWGYFRRKLVLESN
jgi:N-acetyl-anhydromuramoyl-L-alanine amidase